MGGIQFSSDRETIVLLRKSQKTGGGEHMEYIDLVNKIVDAEHSAKEIAREAKEKEESLDEDLARDTAKLREDYFARAQRRVKLVQETEEAAAAEDIARWDQKLDDSMAAVETAYARNKNRWVDALFVRIVGEGHD